MLRFLNYAPTTANLMAGWVTATEAEEPRERRDFPLSQVALFLSTLSDDEVGG
jgi:hypothetical protein